MPRTPGTWAPVSIRTDKGTRSLRIWATDGQKVVEVAKIRTKGLDSLVAQQNACVMGASLKLLAACRAFVSARVGVSGPTNDPRTFDEAEELAGVAIAAAEGL